MKSQINDVIVKNGLKPGDTMLNIHGEEIENSVVLSNYQVMYRMDPGKGVMFLTESPLGGEETSIHLSADAFAIMQKATI